MSDTALGAVIGLLGALLAVFVGSALRGTSEHRKWLRERREELYADVALVADEAAATALALRNAVHEKGSFTRDAMGPFIEQMRQQNDNLERLNRRIGIVGSRVMRSRADHLCGGNEIV